MHRPALQPVVDSEVVHLLQVERDAIPRQIRPLALVALCRGDGAEDIRDVWGGALGGGVEVGVEFAEVGRVERGVEDGGLLWELEETGGVGEDVVEGKELWG